MNHHLLLFWLLLSHYIPIIVSFCPHICCIKPWYMWSYHPSHNGNPRNMQTTSYEPPVFYGNLHQFSHGTARHLGYVGICWDMLGCGSAVGWIPHRTWWTSSQVIPGPSLLLLWLWLLWGFLRGPKNATEESGQCGCCLVGFTTAKGLGILLAVYD